MKRFVLATALIATLATTAHAQDRRYTYSYDRRTHTGTMTVTTLPPSEETIYYSGPSEAEKAAARAEWCKHYQCPVEIPMYEPKPRKHVAGYEDQE